MSGGPSYPSKRDWWLTAIIWGSVAAMFAPSAHRRTDGAAGSGRVAGLVAPAGRRRVHALGVVRHCLHIRRRSAGDPLRAVPLRGASGGDRLGRAHVQSAVQPGVLPRSAQVAVRHAPDHGFARRQDWFPRRTPDPLSARQANRMLSETRSTECPPTASMAPEAVPVDHLVEPVDFTVDIRHRSTPHRGPQGLFKSIIIKRLAESDWRCQPWRPSCVLTR